MLKNNLPYCSRLQDSQIHSNTRKAGFPQPAFGFLRPFHAMRQPVPVTGDRRAFFLSLESSEIMTLKYPCGGMGPQGALPCSPHCKPKVHADNSIRNNDDSSVPLPGHQWKCAETERRTCNAYNRMDEQI